MNINPPMARSVRKIMALGLVLMMGALVGACSKSASTPTAALKAYYDAAKKKDVATAKKYLSSGTLKMMEEFAKAAGKTLDQMFTENAAKDAEITTPEFSNEKINGDTATVDMKAPNMPLVKAQMVKENGEWKLAIDKMMAEMKIPETTEAPKMPESPKASPEMEPKESSGGDNKKESENSNDKENDNENDHH